MATDSDRASAASGTGLSQAEPDVSALRASIPDAHTPGPWEATSYSKDSFSIETADCEVCAGEWYGCTPEDAVVLQANARLIAAAPELLAAAKNAYHTLVPQKDDDFVWAAMSQLMAAIAKATGGSD